MVVSKEELEKGALLSDADAAVGRLRAHRDECRTGGQGAQARLLAEEWDDARRLLQRVMDVWGAAATPAATDDDAGAAMVVLLEEGERAALRRVASAGLQLMANLTAGYPEGAARMFEALVPSGWVLELLEVFGRERPLVACVLVAIHNRLALATSEEDREQAADALVSARALLSKLLRITLPPPPPLSPAPEVDNTTRAAEEEANNDPVLEWSYLLLFQVLKAGKGAALFGACGVRLSSSEESDGEGDTPPVLFSPEQLVVLHLWKQALDDAHARKPTAEDEDDGGAAATNVLLVDGGALCSDLAGRVVRAAAWLDAREGSRATMPPAADELMLAAGCAAAVRLVGGMLAAMDGCASCGQKEALVQQGLAAALLRLLRREGGQADGSIPVVAERKEEGKGRFSSAAAEAEARWEAVEREGRKTQLVRALGNLCHGCRAAQDTVRLFEEQDKGVSPGLALVLNHCNVDSRNPFLREWALLCVRHLCEGNTANQAAIARLEAQAAVQTEGLRAVGVKATLGENGRVGVRRMGKEE